MSGRFQTDLRVSTHLILRFYEADLLLLLLLLLIIIIIIPILQMRGLSHREVNSLA